MLKEDAWPALYPSEQLLSDANPTQRAYEELQYAHTYYNQKLFDGRLSPCLITLQREKHTYGYFSARRFIHRLNRDCVHEIALNPVYFTIEPLREILQTLVHEMVHQWQTEYGRPGRGRYHNLEWAIKMQDIGLMPSTTGKPGGARTGDYMADYIIADGPFDIATTELLSSKFGISWLDRYPPQEVVDAYKAALEEEARQTQVAALANPQLNIDQVIATSLEEDAQWNGEPTLDDMVVAQFAQEGINSDIRTDGFKPPLHDISLHNMLSPMAAGRSNRIKYRCPSCYVQVWGKPALKLRCGNDECENVDFIALDF